jgi:hypothetical protein
MKDVARKSTLAVMAALSSAGFIGGGIASAAEPVPQSLEPEQSRTALKPVNITATQGTLNVVNMQLENMSATVIDAATGAPIAGALIKFTTEGGRDLGTAYTDHTGTAHKTAPENFGLGTAQELTSGYSATLLGDGVHTPVSAHASITIGTDRYGSYHP